MCNTSVTAKIDVACMGRGGSQAKRSRTTALREPEPCEPQRHHSLITAEWSGGQGELLFYRFIKAVRAQQDINTNSSAQER